MRTAFITTLTELAEKDENVWLLTGDLGYSVFENFKERFPKQYLNVGVAEQNLMGIAAGLARLGKRPYVYSISTFASMRAYEQIRNDICYQDLPVVIVGGGSTFSYSTFGCTHMPLEDVAIMQALPRMRVLVPGDPLEVRALLEETYTKSGPVYMRIAKKGEPHIHPEGTVITLGSMQTVREGNDVTIFVSGRQLPNAVAAANTLAEEGISARVLSVHSVKPFDAEATVKALRDTKGAVTIEEHSLIGGLADAVRRVMVNEGLSVPLVALGVPDEFPSGVGSQEWFLEKYNLTETGIIRSVKELVARA